MGPVILEVIQHGGFNKIGVRLLTPLSYTLTFPRLLFPSYMMMSQYEITPIPLNLNQQFQYTDIMLYTTYIGAYIEKHEEMTRIYKRIYPIAHEFKMA
jgi:hypothetical protein